MQKAESKWQKCGIPTGWILSKTKFDAFMLWVYSGFDEFRKIDLFWQVEK